MFGRQHNLPAQLSGKLRPQLVSGKDYKSDNQRSKRRYDSMVQIAQSVLLKVKGSIGRMSMLVDAQAIMAAAMAGHQVRVN